jgi:predicted anti-sigma-YlaC factor YlaD
MGGPPTLDCERARALTSLAIDSEASELEHVALGAHLRVCPDCARFHREAWRVATAVRTVPLEAAPRSLWAARVRRRRTGLGWVAAVAMSLAVAGGMGAAVARMGHSTHTQHQPQALVVAQRPPFSLARELLVFRTERTRSLPAFPRNRLII